MKKLSPQQVADCKRLISFLDQIPARKWCAGELSSHGRHCVLGHLGTKEVFGNFELTPDAEALVDIIGSVDAVTTINDKDDFAVPIKQRILTALKKRLPK